MNPCTPRPVLFALTCGALAAQDPLCVDVRTERDQVAWIALDLGDGGQPLYRAIDPVKASGVSRNSLSELAARADVRVLALDAGGRLIDRPRSAAAVSQAFASRAPVLEFDLRARQDEAPLEAGRPGAWVSDVDTAARCTAGFRAIDEAALASYPRSSVVKLFMTFPNDPPGSYREGSGVMIDPMHVLTAGHCAFDRKVGGCAKEIWVVPAYSAERRSLLLPWQLDMSIWGGREPFGHSAVVAIQTWAAWRDRRDFGHDVAVLALDRPIGALAGHVGLAPEQDCGFYTSNNFELRGYPAAWPFDGSQMYCQAGAFETCPSPLEARLSQLAFPGQSGSGLCRVDAGGNRWAHGVLSHGHSSSPGTVDCVLLDERKLRDIHNWMRGHRPEAADLTPLGVRASTPYGDDAIEFVCLNYSRAEHRGPLSYTICLSNDRDITTGDRYLATIVRDDIVIAPLGTVTLRDQVELPADVAAGTWYLGVVLTGTDAGPDNQQTSPQDVLEITVY